ncbi:primosomal protein DnaI [Lysinibacillus irui]|uniref:Primosomal protein DnaI n=1 Tax=Lysinibacillus irui TaxID=2998077 RepID=A0AAJ5UY43_9BACI|nr:MULTISPECIES: primosomal protein DnaI [Lysinibacillus]MEA0555539.1 primosomal protein DnaI [Lysinibacillus irui]MEA0564923.1 primosomal protein DnaI [Lysinibacillus irui]MEA0977124.1 primosomal protein DnaI [Lysinibacillus irui]MEA1043278.1 primosomal protein DnaI [Lysinibacillus irui]WDV09132.1 primosomal protein DnaI [Lysinibacillus irui]
MNGPLKRAINVPSFQERYEAMRREILEHPQVQEFLAQHADELNYENIERNLPKLHEFISQSTECCGCDNTEHCTNYLKGFLPTLRIVRNSIEMDYVRCEQKVREEERRDVANMIASMHMPKDVLQATIQDLSIDDESRVAIAQKAAQFVKMTKESGQLPSKGFYLFGKFGVGKSFVLGALANELASIKIRSVVVFVPEFLREMKNAIGDNTLNEKIDYIKKAPVLMLDDLGAETMTAWTRDEILGTIFHYRMAEQLPTFITSNFNYDELEHHLAQSQKGDIEVVKAGRIMERIKALTIPIEMRGKNRRM